MSLTDKKTATAKVSHIRISSSKVKIVIDLIRNKPVGQALAILRNTPKAASPIVEKLLLSAMANAENNHDMDVDSLYVAEICANQGPTLKRIRPRAQGRAFRIKKRTCHITLVLLEDEKIIAEKAIAKKAKKKKADAGSKPATPRKTTKKAETKAETTVDETIEEAVPIQEVSNEPVEQEAVVEEAAIAEDAAMVETESDDTAETK